MWVDAHLETDRQTDRQRNQELNKYALQNGHKQENLQIIIDQKKKPNIWLRSGPRKNILCSQSFL